MLSFQNVESEVQILLLLSAASALCFVGKWCETNSCNQLWIHWHKRLWNWTRW